MRNCVFHLIMCLCSFYLCVACSSNPFEEENTDTSGGAGGSTGDSSGGTTGSLLDFNISWDDVSDGEYTEKAETVVTDKSNDEYDDFVENSTFSSVVNIIYSNGSASVSGVVDGVIVTADKAHVTVKSSIAGVEYIISGTASDGSFKIYSDKKFKLTLAGVTLTNGTGAAINIQSGKRAFIEVKQGTENVLTDATSYTAVEGEDEKACLFSEGQLIFGGTGQLTINGMYKHGICSDEYVRIRSGSNIAVASAVKDGIHSNDKIIIGGGTLNVTASSDGIECEEGYIDIRGGSVTIAATDDALSASYEGTDATITPYIKMSDGLLKISTIAEKGMGLKATGNITISGGIVKAEVKGVASKCMKSDGNVTLSGGKQILLTSGSVLYENSDLSSSAGINCDGNLVLNGTVLSVKSTGNAGKGLSCDGALIVDNSTVKIMTTGKQYVYGSLDSSAKGIKAEGNLTINSGTVQVITTGGEGSEGIESKGVLTVNGGNVSVYAYDDCINASKSIVINDGSIYCYSMSNDGIDSNGPLTVTGGTIVSSGTTSPEEGFDCDQNTFKITGGLLLGIGGGSSTPTSSVTTQRTLLYGGSGTAGNLFNILTSDGTHVMSYTIPRAYSQMTILFSSPKLSSGINYTIYTGGSVTGGSTFNGLVIGGTYTSGSKVSTFTPSSTVTTVGNVSSGGGGGGWR